MTQLDHLDTLAARLVGTTDASGWGPLSTGERLYVALAADRADLLSRDGYTMVQALARIGPDWSSELVQRWQYGAPAHACSNSDSGPSCGL